MQNLLNDTFNRVDPVDTIFNEFVIRCLALFKDDTVRNESSTLADDQLKLFNDAIQRRTRFLERLKDNKQIVIINWLRRRRDQLIDVSFRQSSFEKNKRVCDELLKKIDSLQLNKSSSYFKEFMTTAINTRLTNEFSSENQKSLDESKNYLAIFENISNDKCNVNIEIAALHIKNILSNSSYSSAQIYHDMAVEFQKYVEIRTKQLQDDIDLCKSECIKTLDNLNIYNELCSDVLKSL